MIFVPPNIEKISSRSDRFSNLIIYYQELQKQKLKGKESTKNNISPFPQVNTRI